MAITAVIGGYNDFKGCANLQYKVLTVKSPCLSHSKTMLFATCHTSSTNHSKLRDNSELQGGTPLVIPWFNIPIIYS